MYLFSEFYCSYETCLEVHKTWLKKAHFTNVTTWQSKIIPNIQMQCTHTCTVVIDLSISNVNNLYIWRLERSWETEYEHLRSDKYE